MEDMVGDENEDVPEYFQLRSHGGLTISSAPMAEYVNFLTVHLLNQVSFQECENRKQQQQFRMQLIYHNQYVKSYIDRYIDDNIKLGKWVYKKYKAKNE